MFVKHGDGKIVHVLEEEELTDEQKKAMKDLSKQQIKTSTPKESKQSSDPKVSGS